MTALFLWLLILIQPVQPSEQLIGVDWGSAIRSIREACERLNAAAGRVESTAARVERTAEHAEKFAQDASAAAASIRQAADGFSATHIAFAYAAGLSLGIIGSEVGKYAVRKLVESVTGRSEGA